MGVKIGVADHADGQPESKEDGWDRLTQPLVVQERGQNASSVMRYSRQPAVRPTRIW